MVIVDGKTFVTYPENTLFFIYRDHTLQHLSIKAWPAEEYQPGKCNAFQFIPLGDGIALDGADHTGEEVILYDEACANRTTLRLDVEVSRRHILEEGDRFAVLDKTDLHRLIQPFNRACAALAWAGLPAIATP